MNISLSPPLRIKFRNLFLVWERRRFLFAFRELLGVRDNYQKPTRYVTYWRHTIRSNRVIFIYHKLASYQILEIGETRMNFSPLIDIIAISKINTRNIFWYINLNVALSNHRRAWFTSMCKGLKQLSDQFAVLFSRYLRSRFLSSRAQNYNSQALS